MTTIAYKERVIAYDSRATRGEIIVDDDYDKHRESKGVNFFIAGAPSDFDNLISAYFGESIKKDELESHAVVHDNGRIYHAGVTDEVGFWKFEVSADKICSIGSGSEFAMAAMDCGKSAPEAVGIAAGRDTGTGGRIREFIIPGFL